MTKQPPRYQPQRTEKNQQEAIRRLKIEKSQFLKFQFSIDHINQINGLSEEDLLTLNNIRPALIKELLKVLQKEKPSQKDFAEIFTKNAQLGEREQYASTLLGKPREVIAADNFSLEELNVIITMKNQRLPYQQQNQQKDRQEAIRRLKIEESPFLKFHFPTNAINQNKEPSQEKNAEIFAKSEQSDTGEQLDTDRIKGILEGVFAPDPATQMTKQPLRYQSQGTEKDQQEAIRRLKIEKSQFLILGFSIDNINQINGLSEQDLLTLNKVRPALIKELLKVLQNKEPSQEKIAEIFAKNEQLKEKEIYASKLVEKPLEVVQAAYRSFEELDDFILSQKVLNALKTNLTKLIDLKFNKNQLEQIVRLSQEDPSIFHNIRPYFIRKMLDIPQNQKPEIKKLNDELKIKEDKASTLLNKSLEDIQKLELSPEELDLLISSFDKNKKVLLETPTENIRPQLEAIRKKLEFQKQEELKLRALAQELEEQENLKKREEAAQAARALKNGAIRGINVHQDKRDDATSKLVQIFIQHMNKKIPNCLRTNSQLVDQFIRKVESLTPTTHPSITPKEKADAIIALRGGQSSSPSWPTLLNDTLMTLPSTINGRDLLTYLLKFIEIQESRAEKDALFDGLVRALAEGHAICGQGKTQHLMIAIVQGRLKEAPMIDQVAAPTVEQLVTQFFNNPFNRGIEGNGHTYTRSLKFLNKEGSKFLKENRVDKNLWDLFMNEILAFAAADDRAPSTNRQW